MKKIIYGLLMIVVILVILFIVWPSLLYAPVLKIFISQYPQSNLIPEYREISKIADRDTKEYTEVGYDNITLKLPWTEKVDENKRETSTNSLPFYSLTFKGDKKIIISPRSYRTAFLNSGEKKDDLENLVLVFGDKGEIFLSEYEFEKAIINTNLDDFSIFKSKQEIVANSILQMFKNTAYSGDMEEGFYDYTGGMVHIIQIGKPLIDDEFNTVYLIVFDKTEQNSYEIALKNITQKELDFIISSIDSK